MIARLGKRYAKWFSICTESIEYSTRILRYLDDEDLEHAATSNSFFFHNLDRE